MVPSYLTLISEKAIDKGNQTSFGLKCQCSNNLFFISKTNTKPNKDKLFDDYWKAFKVPIFSFGSAIDKKTKKSYYFGRTFLGIKIGKYYYENLYELDVPRIVKVKCTECNQEFIVFDSRLHGYDALIEKRNTNTSSTIELNFSWTKVANEIEISVYNSLSKEEFYEEFKNSEDVEDDSIAFSSIAIYCIVNGTKKMFFEEETA